MEQKVLSKSSMVSRLPKFGARPVNSTPPSLPNGTTQTALTQEGKNPPARPNGVVRASSFSMKWRKDSGGPVDPSNSVGGTIPEEKKEVRSQHSPGSRELKIPSTPATKVRRSAFSLSTGSPKPALKSPKSIPSPKPKPPNSQITTASKVKTYPKKAQAPSQFKMGLHLWGLHWAKQALQSFSVQEQTLALLEAPPETVCPSPTTASHGSHSCLTTWCVLRASLTSSNCPHQRLHPWLAPSLSTKQWS